MTMDNRQHQTTYTTQNNTQSNIQNTQNTTQNNTQNNINQSNNLPSQWINFVLILGAGTVFLLSFWLLLDVWLIAFASILVAIFLLGLADLLKKTPVVGAWFAKKSHTWAVLAVLAMLGLVLSIMAVLFGRELMGQLEAIQDALPKAFEQFKSYVSQTPLLDEWLTQKLSDDKDNTLFALVSSVVDMINLSPAMLGRVLSGVTTFVAIVLVGVFFALSPQIYVRAFVRMTAPAHRDRAVYLLNRSYVALSRWLVGQFVVMGFVGVSMAVGLYFMDIPFAMALGFLAFLLDFVPVLGPWIAAVPMILVTLLFAPDMIVWVLALIVVVQQIESYVVSPLVQHKLVSLPPVALLLSQIAMGVLTGFLGIALATPLVVVLIVWVQVLYVKFVLGDYKIVIMGQSDDELPTDPFNALPKGDIYADDAVFDVNAKLDKVTDES